MFPLRAFLLRLIPLGLTYLVLPVLPVLPLLVSGCTPTLQWVKAGAEPGYSDQQQAACALQAETSFMSSEESAEARAARVARWMSLCMRANGWRQQEVAP